MNILESLRSVHGIRQNFFGAVINDCHLENFAIIGDLHDSHGRLLDLGASFRLRGSIDRLNLMRGQKVSFKARVKIFPTQELLEDLSTVEYYDGNMDHHDLFGYRFFYPTKWEVIAEYPWIEEIDESIAALAFSLN